MHRGDEFYALSKIGPYTFAPYIVAARDNSYFCSSIVSPVMTPWGELKQAICVKHTIIISQDINGNLIGEDEAHYVNAILNSSIIHAYIHATFKTNGFSLKKSNLYIPKYDKKNILHKKLVALSKKASLQENAASRARLSDEATDIYLNLCQKAKKETNAEVVPQKQDEQTTTPLIHSEYQPGFIPLYTLRAACGYFEDGQVPEAEGWIDATGHGFTPDPKRQFAVHAKGDSMLPKIKDGDICIFEWYNAGSRNGEIVLTQSSEYDSEYGGKYTIKRYNSEKTVTDEGWQHSKVELQPLNPDFDTIELNEDGEYRTIGIFKCVL